MGRGKRALAAAAILAALAAASIAAAPLAAAEGGELDGELPVAGGVALVSWSGGPAEALAGAARSRGCNVRSIHEADSLAANAAFLDTHPTGSPASSSVFLVTCGEPIPPRIVFLGDVAEERRAAIRDEVASVVRFYAERFGVAVAESTLYVSPDGDVAATLYRELTGGEYPLFTGEGGTVTDTPDAGILAFVSGQVVNDASDFESILAHEYYHMLQYDILRADGGSHASPVWLIEGTAQYGEDLYNEATRESIARDVGYQAKWDFALLEMDAPFRDAASYFGIQHYRVAASAINWLVEASNNPRSHLEYWQTLTTRVDWRLAFASTFGLTVEEFFIRFEEYRNTISASFPRILGVVVDLKGRPIPNAHVSAEPVDNSADLYSYATTDAQGKFELLATDGDWYVRLGRSPAPTPDHLYRSVFYEELYYNSETGYPNSCEFQESLFEHDPTPTYDPVRTAVDVTGGDVSIVISIPPDLLTSEWPYICNEGRPGFYMISGTVLSHDGTTLSLNSSDPTRGYQHMFEPRVCLELEWEHAWVGVSCAGYWHIRDQEFVFYVAHGHSFRLSVYGITPPTWPGWYSADGFTTNSEQATVFEVSRADIANIEVRLPAFDLAP